MFCLYQMKMIEAVFALNTDDCFLLVDSHKHDDSQGISRTPATTQSMVRILNAEFRCLPPFSNHFKLFNMVFTRTVCELNSTF